MLKRLKYSVTFVSTGRTLAADLDLTKGFTAITGPNESGKSMIFEMARYLLFGTDALRGPADHYRSLKAEGVFDEKWCNAALKNLCLKRFGQPQEIADAVLYLAEADYVTGQTIMVDGGYTV